jgi:hypothetical protein
LSQFAATKIGIIFQPEIILSTKNDRRYTKMIGEVKDGKTKTTKFDSANKLIDHFNQ